MRSGQASVSRWQDTVAWCLVLAVLVSLFVVRAHYGVEHFGDEQYALDTPMRYVAGDRPIVDSWESHFSSGMLLTPVVWALQKAAPGNVGIVLYFRYVFILLQALYACAVWLLLRRLVGPRWAIVSASTVFLYLPYFYVFPYYNNIAIAAFALSALLVMRAFLVPAEHPARFLVAAGVASAIGVIAYPTMLLALPFFAAGIALERRYGSATDGTRRALLGYAVGAGATLAVFALVTFIAGEGPHLLQALPNFADPVDRDLSLHAIGVRFWRTKPVAIVALVTLGSFVGMALVRGRRRMSALALVGGTVAIATAVAALLYRLPVSWLAYIDMQQACALGVGLAVPLLAAARRGPAITAHVLRLACIPGLGVSVGTMVASHEGFETFAMPTIILVLATFVVLAHALSEERESKGRLPVGALAIGVVGPALLLGFYLYGSLIYIGGDATARQLDTTLANGPYKGIRTTRASAEQYEYYLGLFGRLGAEPGRIAFVEEFPMGYLLTGRRPGTYSVWTTYAHGERWQRYLDITGNYPTTIVSTRVVGYGPGSGLGAAPIPPPFGLRDFAQKYAETYRDTNFVVYEAVE